MKNYSCVICVALSFLISGCASHKVEVKRTGFLTSYEQLREDSEQEGMLIYKKEVPQFNSRYTKIIIEPVEFTLGNGEEALKYDREDKQKIADSFYESLEETLGEYMEIVNTTGPDVLVLRTAVTDLLANKVYLNLHWSTTLMGAGIGGASIEVELVDSLTQERILAFIDARKGKRLNYVKGLTKWGHTEEVLEQWAEDITLYVRELKGEDIKKLKVRPEAEFSRP